MSGTKCPNCNTGIKQGTATACDSCHNEIHLTCIGLNSDDLRITRQKSKAIRILCNSCNKAIGEMGDIKTLLINMKQEFCNKFIALEEKIKNISQDDINDLKTSLAALQQDMNGIKNFNSSSINETVIIENVIQEITDREKRRYNVMLFNVIEASSHEETMEQDKILLKNILETAGYTATLNIRINRIGKSISNKARPLKVTLEKTDQVTDVLRKAKEIKIALNMGNISLSADRTPRQVEYYRQVKKSLDDRINNGETNLRIRYIAGLPKIVPLNE